MRIAAAACACFAALSTARSAECTDVPPFIAMYGQWESLAVRAEPATVFDDFPDLKSPHPIEGAPTAVCPGIRFIVEQPAHGTTVTTELTYVYDRNRNTSFGVIVSSDGTQLRGEIRHDADRDTLTIVDGAGKAVWRETHLWTSADAFESEATFDYRGGEGRVWFRTYRVD